MGAVGVPAAELHLQGVWVSACELERWRQRGAMVVCALAKLAVLAGYSCPAARVWQLAREESGVERNQRSLSRSAGGRGCLPCRRASHQHGSVCVPQTVPCAE